MDRNTRSDKRLTLTTFSAYYFVITLFLIASFYPEYRIWGINWWAYYPTWVPLALFSFGLFAPVAIRVVLRRSGSLPAVEAETSGSNRTFFIVAACVTGAFALLFYFLRARTHFLGDGYTLLSELSAGHSAAFKAREVGESLIHLWLRSAIGGDGDSAALLSCQIISIGAGIIFLVTVAIFARSLFEQTVDRILFLLGLCSGGYMLLYFGYVEYYSLFVLSVVVYTLTGLLIVKRKLSRWLILPALAVAVFFHVLGLTLIPSAAYLLLAGSRPGYALSRVRSATMGLLVLLLLAALVVVFFHFYTEYYFFRFAFIPIVVNRFTVEGYTLFSVNHLVDYVNLLMLLLPGLVVVTTALLFAPVRGSLKRQEYRYLVLLTASVLGAVFVFDPKLGMPRDWDLFSFAGVPLAVLAYRMILDRSERSKVYRLVASLSILLGLFSVVPRAYGQITADVAVAHLRNYRHHDETKCRNADALLKRYHELTNDSWAEQVRQSDWVNAYPQETLLNQGLVAMWDNKLQLAANLLTRATRLDPLYWNAWTTLGACYYHMHRLDEALSTLDVAEGLNPHGAIIYSNKGAVFAEKGDLDKSERMFLKSIALDETNIAPYIGLTSLYRMLKRERDYQYFLFKAAGHANAPAAIVKELGDYMLSKRHYQQAAEAYERALQKGLDSAVVKTAMDKYPALKDYLQ